MTKLEIEEYSLWLKAFDVGLDAVIAIAILVGGWLVNKALKRMDAQHKVAEALLAKRSVLFSEVSSDLNRIFCSSAYVGSWLDTVPGEIVDAKRRCDAKMFGEIAFWDSDVLEHYRHFSDMCFATYQGAGTSAKLRADVNKYVAAKGELWDQKQEDHFMNIQDRELWLDEQAELLSDKTISFSQDLVIPSYANLMASIGRCIGGKLDEEKIATALRRPAK